MTDVPCGEGYWLLALTPSLIWTTFCSWEPEDPCSRSESPSPTVLCCSLHAESQPIWDILWGLHRAVKLSLNSDLVDSAVHSILLIQGVWEVFSLKGSHCFSPFTHVQISNKFPKLLLDKWPRHVYTYVCVCVYTAYGNTCVCTVPGVCVYVCTVPGG